MATTSSSPGEFQPIPTVGFWDYTIFILMLGASLGIGIFHASRDWNRRRKQSERFQLNGAADNTEGYFAGGHRMNVFAISISMVATYVHSSLILGYPAEIYYHGAQYWLYCGGQALGAVLALLVFVPVFYPLQMTSVNHYLFLRYNNRIVQWVGMFCGATALLFVTAITLYGPATALETVTDIPDWGYIVLLSLVTVIYTSVGGFRGVIWADVFQSIVMVVGMIAIVAKGIDEVGSLSEIWTIFSKWDRDEFLDFSADPTQRLTFWGLTFGVGLTFMGIYGSSQVGVQRYSSLSSRTKASISVASVIPGALLFTSLACLCGVVVFAYFANENCDPYASKQIKNPNQIVPFFLMKVLNQPGIPGIFLAAMCAGALSTASSCLNSSAANIWEDFLKDVIPDKYKTESNVNIISKLIVVFCGAIAMALAFAVMSVGGTITQAFTSFVAGLGGPLVGLFIMGLFIPWVNWQGACSGTLIGMAFTMWIAFGSYTIGRQRSNLPLPDENCPLPDMFNNGTSSVNSDEWSISGVQHLYTLSFLWFKEAGSGVTIVIGVIVSFLTGATDPVTIHPSLLHPTARWLLRRKGKLMSEADSSSNDPRPVKKQPVDGLANTAFWLSTNDIFCQEKQPAPPESSIRSVTASVYDDAGEEKEYPVERPSGTYTVFTCTSV